MTGHRYVALGPRALLRWQARVLARAIAFAPLLWIEWMAFWSVWRWSGRLLP